MLEKLRAHGYFAVCWRGRRGNFPSDFDVPIGTLRVDAPPLLYECNIGTRSGHFAEPGWCVNDTREMSQEAYFEAHRRSLGFDF